MKTAERRNVRLFGRFSAARKKRPLGARCERKQNRASDAGDSYGAPLPREPEPPVNSGAWRKNSGGVKKRAQTRNDNLKAGIKASLTEQAGPGRERRDSAQAWRKPRGSVVSEWFYCIDRKARLLMRFSDASVCRPGPVREVPANRVRPSCKSSDVLSRQAFPGAVR